MASEDEGRAIAVIQRALRCGLARRDLRQLRTWFEEDNKWRQVLKRRRKRIEKLERELRHVESLPALEVDRYASTARFGMSGVVAAVMTIQGAWRSVLRARRRRVQRAERQDKAACVLQRFMKKYPKLHKKKKRSQGQPAPAKTSDGKRERETPWELPSVQVVRALQARVTAHIEAWRAVQRVRSEAELQDLAHRAKTRYAELKQTGLASSRKDTLAWNTMRQDTAACYLAVRSCHGIEALEADADLDACAKDQRFIVGVYDKEYAELVHSAAHMQHNQMLKAIKTGVIEG